MSGADLGSSGFTWPAEDDDGDPARAGELQRDGGRLGAAARYQVSSMTRTSASATCPSTRSHRGSTPRTWQPPERDGQSDKREIDARPDEAKQRIGRQGGLDRSARWRPTEGRPPSRRLPHGPAVIAEVGGQHFPEPRRRVRRARAVRFVRHRVTGELTAPDSMGDRRHRVREQFPLPGSGPGRTVSTGQRPADVGPWQVRQNTPPIIRHRRRQNPGTGSARTEK